MSRNRLLKIFISIIKPDMTNLLEARAECKLTLMERFIKNIEKELMSACNLEIEITDQIKRLESIKRKTTKVMTFNKKLLKTFRGE